MSASSAEPKAASACESSRIKPLRSLSSRVDSGKAKEAPKPAATAQLVCKLLLERHGDRLVQLLVDDPEGRKLLKSLLAVSFGASDPAGGCLLKRLLERDPAAVVPVLFKRSDDPAVVKGIGACLVRGVSGAAPSELRPLSVALAEAVMDQLEPPGSEAPGPVDHLTEAPAPAAAGEPAAEESTKREDQEDAPQELKRRPTRVQELIEQQQRKCNEQQQPGGKPRGGIVGAASFEGTCPSERAGGPRKSRSFGGFDTVMREALVFATSEASSPELEELCDRVVKFAPPVLTRVIQIEVARGASSDRLSSSASPSAAAPVAGLCRCEQEGAPAPAASS
ncbi:hypothetical protein ACSSS7_002680 [Eimeria intestinalis]